MNAVGIHVFAGGFTLGVKTVMPCDVQLEVHGLGANTAKNVVGVDVVRADRWEDWPRVDADFAFGNPRCTGFSCVTAGCDETSHGPWAKQTKDIHDLVEYSIKQEYPIFVWESVQQAYSTGRELLDYLRDELCVPNGYRIAHIKLCGQAFNNAQRRKRYFFVAYKGDKNFNVTLPVLNEYETTLWDVIGPLEHIDVPVYPNIRKCTAVPPDVRYPMHHLDAECIPHLECGFDINMLAKFRYPKLPEKFKEMWDVRSSEMPFSMHSPRRLAKHTACPTFTNSCWKFIHPTRDRGLSVRELALLMGWGDKCPIGPDPASEIAKGVIPGIGAWLAEQAKMYLEDAWGDEDWHSHYCASEGRFSGGDANGSAEKMFDLTQYKPWRNQYQVEWEAELIRKRKAQREYL